MTTIKDPKLYVLWLASIFGAIAVLPYATLHSGMELSSTVFFSTLIQAAILYTVVVYVGISAAKKAHFQIVSTKKCIIPSILTGLIVGLTLKLLDHFVFKDHAQLLVHQFPVVDVWYRVLASFYGAINEEVLLRLFAVSLITLLLQRLTPLKIKPRVILSILLCALLFAAGHLPMLYKMTGTPNIYDIVRVLFLNGFAGTLFGWLYWRYGLMAAMLGHFTADCVIHVFWTVS